ncbi:MAG: FAD-dependent oxidoreductase, partial [Pseudomonadota bacterium]
MSDLEPPDLCIIGAGAAGLSVAAGAAQMGASTVLIEKAVMGGDCLNFGCIPSKSLIATSRHAHRARDWRDFGLFGDPPKVDPVALRNHIRAVIATIAPHDSQRRFEELGVKVI